MATRTAHAIASRATALEVDSGAILRLYRKLDDALLDLAAVEDGSLEGFLRQKSIEVNLAIDTLEEHVHKRTSSLRAAAQGRRISNTHTARSGKDNHEHRDPEGSS